MGYDITFKEPLREDFLCVICDLALREPRQSICGHRFCHTCIESKLSDVDNFQCPLPDCGYVLIRDKIFCDMFVTRELQQQVVVCRCTWEGLLKDLDNHWRDSCIQSEVACTNVGCNTCLQRKDLEKHLQENCSMRKMSCQHCGDMFTFNNLQDHMLYSCQSIPTACPYNCAITDNVVPRNQLDDHIAHCPLAPCHCQFSEIGCTYKKEMQGAN
uniref:TNF receptor-associated factor 3-like n=1 Tax=Saccoglossus kowalevskii TaxID=10224 RepID=A0ABM0MK81_SACKO|nr:PREDICTED: TNF receptor-associated factor 3-like [Saccoglossus kowalevskii]